MQRRLCMLAIGIGANALAAISALAQGAPAAAPEVTLTRLECGIPTTRDVGARTGAALRFSDTYDFEGLKVQIVYSCYLIKHGDHIGQVDLFPKSTLLIGKGDWEALTDPAKAQAMADPTKFAAWIKGGSKVEPVPGDKDVFDDGTVVMLNTPGHTPGHHSLLVKLKENGYVLLSGDLAHFRENYDTNGVPMFNTDHTYTLGSLDRFKKIAANLKATVVIQHDGRDVGKPPVSPAPAK